MANPVPVAVAIFMRDHDVFLVRRARGRPFAGEWEFPGGKVEFGEAPLDALRREVKEELGLPLETATLFGVYSHVYVIRGRKVHYVLLVYQHRVPPEALREGGGAKWFGPDALRTLPVIAGSKPIVEDLLRLWRVT